MPAVNPSELQTLSDWMVLNILTESCAIQREVNSLWVTQATVPCAIVGSSYRGDMADELKGADMKDVLMPRNTDVRSPDRFIINGIKYRVFDVKDPETFEVLRRIQVVRFPARGGA